MQRRVLFILLFNLMIIYWYGCSEEKAYSFLDNLNGAKIITGEKGNVTKSSFVIEFDWREVLFEHPNAEVMFENVFIVDKALLTFGIGIEENVWESNGDGVLFEIRVIDEKLQKLLLYSRYIDPKSKLEDRKWFDEQIDLNSFAGQRISFIFKTSGGYECNIHYDWAGWSDPKIVSIKKSNK